MKDGRASVTLFMKRTTKRDVVHRFTSTQPVQAALASPRKPKLLLLAAVYFLVFLPNVRLPSVAADESHDLGSQMSYEFYARHGYQFGVDVIQNVGPYGYLQFPAVYSGLLTTRKVIFLVAFAAIFSAMVLLASRYFATPLALALWLLPVVTMQFAIGPLIDSLPLGTGVFSVLDSIFYLFLLLAGHHLLTRERDGFSVFFDMLLLVLLALISLTKGTNLMLVAAIMAVTLLQDLKHKMPRRAPCEAGCFAAAVVLFWLLARQRLANFPRFLLGFLSFSKGYSETMELSFPGEGYLWACARGVPCFLGRRRHSSPPLSRISAPNRLDGSGGCRSFRRLETQLHPRRSRHFLLDLCPACQSLVLSRARARRCDRRGSVRRCKPPGPGVAEGASPGRRSGAAPAPDGRGYFHRGGRPVVQGTAFRDPLRQAAADSPDSSPSLPGVLSFRERFNWLDRAFQENQARAALPSVKQAVGTATIDHYGNLPGLILLNHLTYRPRPMPWTFLATNDELMRRNAEFYGDDATAPEYILACVGTPDDRFAPQDDSLAMLQLLRRYRPILSERGLCFCGEFPLRLGNRSSDSSLQEYAWGDRILIPSAPGQLPWCEVEISPSLAGQCCSFFYRPAPVRLVLESGVTIPAEYKFLACAGKTGFLIAPLILDNRQLLSAYGIKTNSPESMPAPPDAILFRVEPAFCACFHDEIKVAFFVVQ